MQVRRSKSSLEVAFANAGPIRRSMWMGVAIIAVGMLLVDCWWNERIWSLKAHQEVFAARFQKVGLRASVSKASDGDLPPVERRSAKALGQQLVLDLVNCSGSILNDEDALIQATQNVAEHLEVVVAHISIAAMDPEGFGIVANFGDSHFTMHTWPTERDALINIMIADEDNDENLRELLPILGKLFGGNITQSTFSIVPRGREVDLFDNPAFSPPEIMTRHQYKALVSEVQSPYQNVAIWDHHDELDDTTTRVTSRSLFLDGVMQSSIADEFEYHEALVQPAFIAAVNAPKRVLIVGGGEGGTLRETLKWKSVEEAVMVDLDAEVINSSRRHLMTYNNCTGFGTASCFDDPRAKVFTMDFFKWFDDNIGDDICTKRDQKRDSLFDIIILDLLDTEELPEGQAWAEYLYSNLFFERIACATNDHGVVVSNFGEAPETPFEAPLLDVHYPSGFGLVDTRIPMFTKKMEQLRSFSHQFHHFRVYDAYVEAFRASWVFAMGVVPRVSSTEGLEDVGINYFDGKPVQINHKLRNGMHPSATLMHYDGNIQQVFRRPTGDWAGAFCDVPTLLQGKYPQVTYRPSNMKASDIQEICNLPKRFTPDESTLWKVATNADGAKKVVALSDLNKGTILGVWDEVFPGADEIITTAEKSCDPNMARLVEAEPHTADPMWNPKLNKMRTEISSSVVLLRAVKSGESLTLKGGNC